ncbi:hypothetical protein MKZ08_19885 [Viridibacillus sp. FSL R5-0477]|uniref:Uncharacterized protein n=1 Tax=Viridibacillus arenosi FSL R5-213 TaxID=1227360 RepID=W4F588_9BACL|nr:MULTISPECIES: hypothetical protein [Viridibacillus]ETT87301.1 hypothetical protein C176_04093 [Viridibacillus arenosi FSL R5-213]OMC80104.1 hypothetical protein BK130_17220 [Viridibacillus sp. FSL H8-0123]OMC87874.1 hypothetical protein BK128_06020 [Viridibacillus sp. FSL H7-0596]OMC91425.1 hypothetical protein BK137_10145 [Viridibacillus arenosi]
MKLAARLNNQYTDIENRKRALRQKNAGDAYRKTAQYFQPKSNPALEELMDLLTGKKEKQHQPQVQAAIRELQQKDHEFRAKAKDNMEQTSPLVETSVAVSQVIEKMRSSTSATLEKTTGVLERVHHSALEPMRQDVRTEDENEIIQQTRDQITKVKQPVTTEDSTNQFGQVTNSTQTLEQKLKQRLFDRAISRYSYHVQMAKSGFRVTQPSFYRIA